MAAPFEWQVTNPQQVVSAAPVNHLPIVAHFARRLGLMEIINRLVTTRMEVEPGFIVLGLVLDTLSGRSPLYHGAGRGAHTLHYPPAGHLQRTGVECLTQRH